MITTYTNNSNTALNAVAREFERLFDGLTPETCVAMPMDIVQGKANWTITADLPGFTKEQVKVDVHEGVLCIAASATTCGEQCECEGNYVRRERGQRNVTRRIRLPDGVTEEGVTANLKDGVLTITIPQPAKALPRTVKVG